MTIEVKSQGPLPPPWDRIFSLGTKLMVWSLMVGIIYVLRPFFLLVFLTFVFAYVQEHGVLRLRPLVPNRIVRAVLVFVVVLGSLVGIGFFAVPQIQNQAKQIADDWPKHMVEMNKGVDWFREKTNLIPKDVKAEDLLHDLVGFGAPADAITTEDKAESGKRAVSEAIDKLKTVGGQILSIGSAFLLSLLFSFLIVLDLPRLARGIRGLEDTKLRFIYEEVADSIHDFGLVLGRSLEAQLFIALLNTLLTAIGLYFMGLPNIVFLSMIVFFASFIPVAGVFISSTPICLVALSNGGMPTMMFAIALILVIHFIEAYILNPRIFGHHLRMNPVLVLIVLTVAGKLFGVWGLVLALPVVNYFFGYAIRDRHVENKIIAA